MRTIVVQENQAGKRIDRIVREAFPNMPVSAMYKAFRKKDVKVNGVRVREDHAVMPGDSVEVFIVDEILDGKPMEADFRLNRGFTAVYEDSNILIVNKEQGIPVHPDREQSSNTLIDLVRDYLQQKGEYDPKDPSAFAPSLCHRLDRNTGGLIIIAKNSGSLKAIMDKLESNEIRKFYRCLVTGKMERQSGELKAFLIKDENKSRVFVEDYKSKGALEIITRYRVLDYKSNVSALEVELVTGRTHQIRAHMAHIGHPIIGDGKYGTNAVNRAYGAKFQALWACRIVFDFKTAGMLSYLKGRKFEVEPGFKVKNL